MKRIAVLLAVIMASMLTAEMSAAKELTLDDCIEIALEKRAAIIRARGAETQAVWTRASALGDFLPSVRAGYSYSKGKETGIMPPNRRAIEYDTVLDDVTINGQPAVDTTYVPSAYELVDEQTTGPSKNWSLSASMDLVNVSTWFNYAGANAGVGLAKLDVLASEQDMIYAVKTAYYAYLAAAQNVTVQEEAVKRSEEQLKLIQSKFELGSASKSDVLKQKVLYGNDQLAFLRATNAVTNSKANLAYTIGLDPRQDNEFSSDYRVREYEGTLDDAVDFSMNHNPSLLAGQKSADQAKHYLRSAWATYLPTVSASASLSKFKGTQAYPFTFNFQSNSRSIGFQVSWNIFDGFLRERQVAGAKVARNNALADLADTRNATISNVKTSYLEIDQLKKQLEVAQENVAAAEEDMKITQEKYNLGAATILDLLNAQVSLKTAQVGHISAQFDLNLAIANLENAMGKM